jgi:3-deoxy-D-manno-octulosonic-acid transferase
MIYTLFLWFYQVVIILAAKFGNIKAQKWLKGRSQWRKQLPNLPKNATLFHCASLGEFDQAVPVIQAWKQNFPDDLVVISFYSPSGMEHFHKRGVKIDDACYLPLDTERNMEEFISILAPQRIFLVKYEFWPNLIRQAKAKEIPIFSISTLLRSNQLYFKWYGVFFRNEMKKITHFFAQNQATEELLKSISCSQVSVVGDTRYDTVLARKRKNIGDKKIEDFMLNRQAIILGSSWEREEEILSQAIHKLEKETFIIAPHEVTEATVKRLKKLFPQAVCYTDNEIDTSKNILILDTIGQLANAYAHGWVAFIGGGFHGSLHNILEPAVYGLPVCFGPKHTKFPEASVFLKNGFSREIQTAEDLVDFINEMKNERQKKRENIESSIQGEQGAAEKILKYFS